MEENENSVPTEEELAACSLMVELARSSRLITRVGDQMLERLDSKDHPGETGEVVVLREMIETVTPHLRETGAEFCWQAARMIEQIRSEIVLEYQLTAEGRELQ